MKYFTKKLFTDINSSDRTVVEKAHKQWNKNLKAYWKYIDSILPKLPKGSGKCFRNMSLHDGDVISLEMGEFARADRYAYRYRHRTNSFVEMSVAHPEGKHVYTLKYSDITKCLIDYPGEPHELYPNPFGWWLYDELSLTKDDSIRHEIFFMSDATILIEAKKFSCKRKLCQTA